MQSINPIQPIRYQYQTVLFNDIIYFVDSYFCANGKYIYKKNRENTLFIYYTKQNEKVKGSIIENKVAYDLTEYFMYSSIQHTDGYCYDNVGIPCIN